LLGFNNIYRLVLDKSIQGIMPRTEESRAIQEHSYVVSVFAYEIARLSGKVAPPLAVTVGLLHDVGKSVVLLFKQRHPELATSFDLLDPSAVGAGVLASWRLPTDIVKIVEEQSRFAYTSPDQMSQEYRHAIAALYLAHGCCNLLTENVNESTPGIFADEYLADLGFQSSSLKDFYLEIVHPAIVKEKKSLPEPIRRILSLGSSDDQME
jgi:HD-like signal output (HDOD) protein